MNEKLDLIEILKDAPKGTKLWSPICGECEFKEIREERFSPIKCEALEDRVCWLFRSDGTYALYEDAECLLFPSKYNRDWSTFKNPKTHKEFELNQKDMEKEINNNGYDYVDLGLPSGTLWATMNVGASKPSDNGLYFQWGDAKGYSKDQVGKDKRFASNWSDYKWGTSSNFSKYTTEGAKLELEDDAAHVNMGGAWHMPTPTQIQELLDNTTTTWTTQDGVNGRLFTSKKDGSKSIFIPAAGDAWDGSVQYSGDLGYVWSSMLNTDNADVGQDLYFGSDDAYLDCDYRCLGLSVRGVVG